MTKNKLINIIESLNLDDEAAAQAALHEWFVEQGKAVQAQLSGQPVEEQVVTENTEDDVFDILDWICGQVAETGDQEGTQDFDYGEDLAEIYWKVIPYVLDDHNVDPAHVKSLESLAEGREIVDFGYYDSDEIKVRVAYVVALSTDSEVEEEVDEARVDELSRDTMMSYAKQARKDRDRPSSDDEKVGRRVAGLGMVANKARQEKAKPQYESVEESADDIEESQEVNESEDDLIAELSEAFKGLETVSDKLQNQEGAQVGEQGKVPVNTKSTLPNNKGDKRLAGEPVEIKGKGHTGHAMETSPKVVDQKIKNTVQNGKEELKKVAAVGDKSALLNKMDGSVNTQSPISGKGAKGLSK